MNQYNNESIKRILQIFESNQIKLEFESIEKLFNCFGEIEYNLVNEALKNIFEQSKKVKLVELDLYTKKVLSTGIGYPYSTSSFCYYPQFKEQIEIISNIFSYNPRATIDLLDMYMVMYTADINSPENFYYTIDKGVFLDIDESSILSILKNLGINGKSLVGLKRLQQQFCLDYIGFDLKNNISKISFTTTKGNILSTDYVNTFSSYNNFDKIFDVIDKNFTSENKSITIQHSPFNENYIAVELSISPGNLKLFAKELYNDNVIDENIFLNFENLVISPKYVNCVVKFRWNAENEFTIKLYLEESLI